MPTELLSMLINLPIVAVFIWYSERLYDKFSKFLVDERAERKLDREEERRMRLAFEAQMTTILASIKENLAEHDERMELAIAVMKDRTQASKTNTRRTP